MPTADKDIATMFMAFAGHCMGVIALALHRGELNGSGAPLFDELRALVVGGG